MDIRVSKVSNRVSKRHADTPLAKDLQSQSHCAEWFAFCNLCLNQLLIKWDILHCVPVGVCIYCYN